MELRVTLRRLRRGPVFVGVSVATLGLAIGLNAATFSIADAVLFRPLPYSEPDQLHVLRLVNRQTGQSSSVAARQLLDSLEGRGGSLAGVARRGPVVNVPHAGPDGTESIGTIAVAPDFLTVLGVRALHGRVFDSRDAAEPGRAVLLTYGSWRNRFGADLRVVGQSVTIAGHERDVVGVLPRDFIFPAEGLAYPFAPSGRPNFEFLTVAQVGMAIDPLVRIKAGVTPAAAESEIKAVVQSLRPGFEPRLSPLRSILFPVGSVTLRMLLLAAAFVLVLGCANLSHLFLIRVRERQHEVTVSLALGATRWRIVRALFLESLFVGLGGALAALVIAVCSFNVLQRLVPTALSGGATMGVDWRVTLFTLALGVASAVVFTALPAWTLATADIQGTSLSRRPDSWRQRRVGEFGTVILQVAVAMVLVAMAIGATRHFLAVVRQPLGFSSENVLIVHSGSEGPVDAFYAEVVQRLANRPDVVSAGAVEALPLSGAVPRDRIPVTGADPIPLVRTVPGYFETAGLRLLEGRLFNSQDSRVASPAVVSESAAALLFPGLDPVGRPVTSASGGPFTVVGVVSDVRMTAARSRDPLVYAIVDPTFTGRMELVARLRDGSPHAPVEIRQLVGSLAREMPVTIQWWSESIDGMAEYRTPRFQSVVLGTVATLAMALAALGLFGVVSSYMGTRMHEVAIRLALGAMPGSIARRLVLRVTWPVLIGLCAGLVGTWLTGRALTAQVGFQTWAWPVILGGAAVILSTAMLSTYLPARKASRLPAMTVLRSP